MSTNPALVVDPSQIALIAREGTAAVKRKHALRNHTDALTDTGRNTRHIINGLLPERQLGVLIGTAVAANPGYSINSALLLRLAVRFWPIKPSQPTYSFWTSRTERKPAACLKGRSQISSNFPKCPTISCAGTEMTVPRASVKPDRVLQIQ